MDLVPVVSLCQWSFDLVDVDDNAESFSSSSS